MCPKGGHNAYVVDKSFILGDVVGGLEVELEGVSELASARGYK